VVRTKSNTEEQSNQSDAVSFESALERLEEITDQLENGELGLDDSLKLYTEGIALARRCNQQLTLAEEKVAKLLSADGTLTDFSINESEGKSGQ
jgi:exodeoxyribonuclease VII small subunit